MITYSKNAHAIITLCSTLQPKNGMMPLSAAEWGVMAKRLFAAGLEPKDVPDMADGEFHELLGFDPARIRKLLERVDSIHFEYEKLARNNIMICTRADKEYPTKLKERLLAAAPPLFYYAGDISLAKSRGIAVTGSRKLDAAANDFALEAAVKVAKEGYTLYAGGADGTDNITEAAALRLGGRVVSYLAGSMEYKLGHTDIVEKTRTGRLLLLSTLRPDVQFVAENAPPRNKYIYASAEAAFVVSSDNGKGVAWEGASECLRNNWVPVFVRRAENPRGNMELLKCGGIGVNDLSGSTIAELVERSVNRTPEKQQTSLFGMLD